MSMPRSRSRSSTFRSERGNRTYIMTARRMILSYTEFGFRVIGSHCPSRHLWRAVAAVEFSFSVLPIAFSFRRHHRAWRYFLGWMVLSQNGSGQNVHRHEDYHGRTDRIERRADLVALPCCISEGVEQSCAYESVQQNGCQHC